MIPLVSVIIPTYKRSDYIIRAINSVINQTNKNIEIIVVDDNELNNEFSIVTENKFKEFNLNKQILYIKYLNNRGVSATRNIGVENAKGKYIAFVSTYINRPLHFTILIKICLLFLGKKIFSYKKNILNHLKSFKKIFKDIDVIKFKKYNKMIYK